MIESSYLINNENETIWTELTIFHKSWCKIIIIGTVKIQNLTNNAGSYESSSIDWRVALWIEGLQDVVGEGEGDDGIAGRHDHDQGHPKVEEAGQGPEGLADVRVVAARLWYHCSWKKNIGKLVFLFSV